MRPTTRPIRTAVAEVRSSRAPNRYSDTRADGNIDANTNVNCDRSAAVAGYADTGTDIDCDRYSRTDRHADTRTNAYGYADDGTDSNGNRHTGAASDFYT